MNVLITGGTGFIGSRLALRCLGRGDTVAVLGQTNTEAEVANKNDLEAAGVRFVLGSVTDRERVAEAVRGIDIVFHLAAAQHEMNIPDERFREVNVEGTRIVIEASIEAGVRALLHGSTIGVYGVLDGVIDETSPCAPDNIYGITKLEGEKLALSYGDRLPVVVARIPEVYGPGDRRLVKLFRALQKRTFIVIGSGRNLHHPIYVEDLIDGFLAMVEHADTKGEVFLLSGNRPISTDEMVGTVADELEVKPPRFHFPFLPFWIAAFVLEKVCRPLGIQPPLHRRRMDFFRKSFELSHEKASRLFGFSPSTSFAAGAAATARWYAEAGLIRPAGAAAHPGRRPRTPKARSSGDLAARLEAFDSFWEAPENVERGYGRFETFYRRNYLGRFPGDKTAPILVVSCGPGYMVRLLAKEGYTNVTGLDSMEEKIRPAVAKQLNCRAARAFEFLRNGEETYGAVFCEQEINHLTKEEMLDFVCLCHDRLRPGGVLIVHSLNGANPLVGSENLAMNLDHFSTLTEYSIAQALAYAGFGKITVFPLNLYVFYTNPLNYVGMGYHAIMTILLRITFRLYGKSAKIFTKKIGARGVKAAGNA